MWVNVTIHEIHLMLLGLRRSLAETLLDRRSVYISLFVRRISPAQALGKTFGGLEQSLSLCSQRHNRSVWRGNIGRMCEKQDDTTKRL